MRIKIAHASLQYSDTPQQHTDDLEKLFAQGYDIISGTEAGAGANNTRTELKRVCKKYGYKLSRKDKYDTWNAVRADLIEPGSFKAGAVHILERSEEEAPNQPGRWLAQGLVFSTFTIPGIGEISMGTVHTLTWKSTYTWYKIQTDKLFAKTLGKWFKKKARGKDLGFCAGDFNRKDKPNDLFFGEPITSCWDELKKYPKNTHGLIDAIGSYDKDVRVRCVGARSFTDKQFFLNSDHDLILALYEIEPLQN